MRRLEQRRDSCVTGIIINDPWNLERKGVNKMSSRWCPGVTVHVWIKGTKA